MRNGRLIGDVDQGVPDELEDEPAKQDVPEGRQGGLVQQDDAPAGQGEPERGPGMPNNYADQVRRTGCGLRKRIRVNLQTEKMNLQSEGFLEANRADSQSRKMNSESRAYLNVDQRC